MVPLQRKRQVPTIGLPGNSLLSRFLNDAFSERPSLTTSQKGVSYTAGEKVNGTSPYIAKLGFYILFDHLIPLLGMYLNICLHAYNDVFTR